MMTKDQNGKFKNIINYILVLLGINGVICILTTIFGLATDKRLLGSYDLSIISTINKLMWNIQFFSFILRLEHDQYSPDFANNQVSLSLFFQML